MHVQFGSIMPDRDEQPGLEPVFPGYSPPRTPFPQPDHSGLQSLLTGQDKNLSRSEKMLSETHISDSSLEPVRQGYYPEALSTQPDHSGLQSFVISETEKFSNLGAISYGTPAETLITDRSKSGHSGKTGPSHRRRMWYISGGVAAVLCVILVAVLTGVFVSKANHKQSSTGSVGTTSPTSANSTSNSSTITLSQIRQGSDLTVAGWRTDAGIQLFLYYQDINGTLRYSEYDSGRGSFTTNNSYWEESETIVSVAGNTSVAAGMIVWRDTDAVSHPDHGHNNPSLEDSILTI